MTLRELWDVSKVPLFDMDAPGYNEFAQFDIRKGTNVGDLPGYIGVEQLQKDGNCDVDEVSWHNCGISVKLYKEDSEDEEDNL